MGQGLPELGEGVVFEMGGEGGRFNSSTMFSSFKLKRGILPPLTKLILLLEDHLSHHAIIFLAKLIF